MMNDYKKQYLLSGEHITEISSILDSHIRSLRKIKRFKELEKEMFELSDSIYSSLPDDKKEEIEKLIFVMGEMEAYTNTLLHSLGIKFGIELKKL